MNVYYLPSRNAEADKPATSLTAPRWSVLRARTARLMWQLRLTGIDVWSVLRNGGRHPLEDHVFTDDAAVAPRRPAAGPARILDLEAGRRRRVIAVARAAVAAAASG